MTVRIDCSVRSLIPVRKGLPLNFHRTRSGESMSRRGPRAWVIVVLAVLAALSIFPMAYIVLRIANRVVGIVTVDDLWAHGYYVYLLPEDQERAGGWTKEISISSYSRECYDADSLGWNPIFINYARQGEKLVNLTISFEDQLWDDEARFPTVPVNVRWSDTKQAEVNRQEDGASLRIEDRLGMDVVLSSSKLNEEALISLLESLEYQGAVPLSSQKPWDTECGSLHATQPD
jgi:hypothetical protein